MKNADVEALLNTAVNDAVPDVLDSILSRCEEREGKVIEMKPAVTPIGWLKPMLSAAAALVLIVGGAWGANGYVQNAKTAAVVSLDVNPSIEIEANRNEKVLAVRGLNADGEQVIAQENAEGTKLEGEKLDTVVAALVGTMVEDGYLSEMSNSVLVSVDSGDTEKSAALKQSLMVSVSTAMTEKGVDGAVLGQSVTDSEKLNKEASELGVSKGKAGLIAAISAQNPQYSTGDLARLSINDLGLLLKDSEKEAESVEVTGTPSSKKYVSAEAAIDEVCAEAKVSVGEGTGASAKIALEDGKLVYDVSLTLDSKPVTCAVDAITGRIIGWINTILGGDSDDADSSKDSGDTDDADDDKKDDTETTTPGTTTTIPTPTPSPSTGTVGQVIDGTIDGVGSVVGGVVDGVGNVVGGTVDGVGSVVDSTIGGVGSVVDTTVGGVGNVIDSALTGGDVEGAAEDYADSVEDAAEKLADDITEAAEGLVDKITGSTGTTGGTGTGTTGTTDTTGGTTGGSIGGTIGSIISGLFS